MNEENESVPRRVLVALDAASLSRHALEAAAKLAARMQAELYGLFVEDDDLLRAAALPFVRQYSITGAGWHEFSIESLEHELKIMASRARRTLEKAAQQANVPASFHVARGPLTTQIVEASQAADLIILQGSCRPLSRYLRMDAPSRAAVLRLDRSVLLLEAEVELPGHVVVIFDGTSTSMRALRLAARLAEALDGRLDILLLVDETSGVAQLEANARSIVDRENVAVEFQAVPIRDTIALLSRMRQERPSLLVLSVASSIFSIPGQDGFIEALGCPLLLVR
ncbi:MAG TPA: universal stress protein [Alphaproteobacteria bacterium]|nr:universal stress protein [Alphaproteobacteria bacterium]